MDYSGPLECRSWFGGISRGGGTWPAKDEFDHCSYRSLFEHLTAVRQNGALNREDFPLICVLRNEQPRLEIFFDHYKKLGITRFIMVDNNSDDRSQEIMLAERSADIYFTRKSFLEGQAGLYWANGLAQALCRNHWTLRVDADELLIYDGMEKHGLADLASWLRGKGLDRLYAPMRDVYTSSTLAEGEKEDDIAGPLENDCWFDSDGYESKKCHEGWYMTGGPRQRLFGHGPNGHRYLLVKYPFFLMSSNVSIVNSHYLWPFDKARVKPFGALLHLKLLGDFVRRSIRYEREGQHWNKSRTYRATNLKMKETPSISPYYPGSKRYEGAQSFVRHGLMQAIDWDV